MSKNELQLRHYYREAFRSVLEKRLSLRLAREHAAVVASPLGGHPAGPIEIGSGETMLVTRTPRLVTPAKGEWSNFGAFLGGLIPDEEQRLHLFGWIKTFLVGLHARRNGEAVGFPGQALVIAGPPNCGKTLFKRLLTRLCGGRTANPHQYMTGGTNFNAECAGAEILEIDDEQEGADYAERRKLASGIKKFCVAGPVRIHPKGLTPVVLEPYQRLLILGNDGTRDLLGLPEAESSVIDKIMILRACPPQSPFPTATEDARKAFFERLESELPAFAHHLLDEFEIPDDLSCDRFGVRTYHDPDLLRGLNALDQLSGIIETLDGLFDSNRTAVAKYLDEDGTYSRCHNRDGLGQTTSFTGTASQIRAIVAEVFGDREMREAFGKNPVRTGVLLRQVEERHPERVTSRSRQNRKIWTIFPPPHDEDPDPVGTPGQGPPSETTPSSTCSSDVSINDGLDEIMQLANF